MARPARRGAGARSAAATQVRVVGVELGVVGAPPQRDEQEQPGQEPQVGRAVDAEAGPGQAGQRERAEGGQRLVDREHAEQERGQGAATLRGAAAAEAIAGQQEEPGRGADQEQRRRQQAGGARLAQDQQCE